MKIKKIDRIIIEYIINNKISIYLYVYIGIACFASVYFFKDIKLDYFSVVSNLLNSSIFVGILLIPVATLQAILTVDLLHKNLLFQQRFLTKSGFTKHILTTTCVTVTFLALETLLFLLVFTNVFGFNDFIFINFTISIYFIVNFFFRLLICALITILLNIYLGKICAIFINIFLGAVILFETPININKFILYKTSVTASDFSIMSGITNYLILLGTICLIWKIVVFSYGKKMFEGAYK